MTIETAATIRAFADHEHRDLVGGLNRIHEAACEVGRAPTPRLLDHVLSVIHWIEQVLEPHVAWEEAWLFPEIDARAGTPWATRSARFDHGQIRAMTSLVRADRRALVAGGSAERNAHLSCHLFGLEALVRAHLEREERFLLPVLDAGPVVAGWSTR